MTETAKKSHKAIVSPIRRKQIALENDIYFGYACCTCGKSFKNRNDLATHPHEKVSAR